MALKSLEYDDGKRKMEIGQRVRAARRDRRVKQTELAERIGCSRIKLNRVEHGQAALTAIEIDRLARLLDTPVERFFSTDDKN